MRPFFSKSRSLQKQLFSSLVVSLLAIFSVFWWLSQMTIHTITEDYLLTRLAHDTDTLQQNLSFDGRAWYLNLDGIGPIYHTPQSGHYFVVKTPKQRILSPSLETYPLYLKARKGDSEVVYKSLGPLDKTLLMRSVQFEKQGQIVEIYVAEDHTPIQNLLLKFDVLFSLFTLLSLVSIYFLHQWLIRRSFAQLSPLESTLRAFQLGHQIQLDPLDYPLEVQSLIESLNLALAQSSLQFKKSRQLNGNLSHSLKTPLHLIFQLLDSDALKACPELQANLKQQSEKILSLIERELKVDRIAHHQVISPLQLNLLLADLIPTFQQLYRDKNVQLESFVEDDVWLKMEQEDAFELLGNLLDNASKWCHSKVQIHYIDQRLVIEDDGPGCSGEQLTLLEERGYRTDETKPGHGIGLSIVKELMVAYQAEISFSHSSLGGLKVQIKFS